MKTKQSNPNELKVGIFILVPVVLIVLFVVVKLGLNLIGSTIDVYLKLDDITGIKEGTSIKLKGYEIGRVIKVEAISESKLYFLATMRIKNEIKIYKNCLVEIRNQNVIGDTVIEIKNSDKEGNPLEDGEVIKNKDIIEGPEHVNLDVVLHKVQYILDDVEKIVNSLEQNKHHISSIIANINSTTARTNRILSDSEDRIQKTLERAEGISENVEKISAEFKNRPAGFLLRGSKDK